jgi:hypothetical protein
MNVHKSLDRAAGDFYREHETAHTFCYYLDFKLTYYLFFTLEALVD